jgi:cytochrome oxidase Cu insertion factor (SCO1/SenC/PrrC family)
MRSSARRLASTFAALLLSVTVNLTAQVDSRSAPPDEDRYLNAPIPDIALTTATGGRTRLSEVGRGRPVLLAFVFTRCTGVCSPFLQSWRMADRSVSHRSAFHRLVVSFDPRDSAADMALVADHLDARHDPDWTFAIADQADVRRLAEAAGFWYDWSEARQQFDHPAMLAAVRNGRLVRLLIGGEVSSGRLDELVREVSGEFVASYPLAGRVRFRCVQFDAATGRTTLDWGFVLLLVPMAGTAIATSVVFAIGGRRRAKALAEPR